MAQIFATAAPSQKELSDANLVESVVVSIPATPGTTKAPDGMFSLLRKNGAVKVVQSGDLTAQPLLLVDITITWLEHQRALQRGNQDDH